MIVRFRIVITAILLFNKVACGFGILDDFVVWVVYYCVCVTACVWFVFVVRCCVFPACCSVCLVAIFGLVAFVWWVGVVGC